MFPSRRKRGPRRRALVASLVAFLIGALVQGCVRAAPISPIPGETSASIVAPAPSAEDLGPILSQTARPGVTFPPVVGVTMTRLGSIDAPWATLVVPFARGYVGFAVLDDDVGTLATWFSADGWSWKRTIQSNTVVPCSGWSARSDLDGVYVGEAVDDKVVIIAALLDPTTDVCDQTRLVALVSSDGTTWQRSAPFGPADAGHAWSEQGWTIPGGMEIIANELGATERLSTWRSSNGLTWQQVAPRMIDQPGAQFRVFGAAPDGVRLASSQGSDHAATNILASDDGSTWRTVRTLPIGLIVVDAIPPLAPGGPWLVVTAKVDEDQRHIVVLVSADLAAWTSAPFPRTALKSVHLTRSGWIGVGEDPSIDMGCGSCPRPDAALYTSQDGVRWTRQMPKLLGEGPTLVDGPAGLLAIDSEGEHAVSLVEFH